MSGSRRKRRRIAAPMVHHDRIELDEGIRLITDAEDWLESSELPVASDRVLRLTSESGCSAYDCEFVALAEALGVPLVTLDRQLLLTFPRRAVSLDNFAFGREESAE